MSAFTWVCDRSHSLLLPHLGSCPSSNNMAGLSRDGWLLFAASLVRLFSQGCLSVTLLLCSVFP